MASSDRSARLEGAATLVVDGRAGFYRVDLLAGTALLIGSFSKDKTDDFSDPVIDIAIPLDQ